MQRCNDVIIEYGAVCGAVCGAVSAVPSAHGNDIGTPTIINPINIEFANIIINRKRTLMGHAPFSLARGDGLGSECACDRAGGVGIVVQGVLYDQYNHTSVRAIE